jgi:hypothetical protein
MYLPVENLYTELREFIINIYRTYPQTPYFEIKEPVPARSVIEKHRLFQHPVSDKSGGGTLRNS